MTYVIGIHSAQFKFNAIICDTKCQAVDKREGRVAPSLKNGLLFAGCMFGASGTVDHIFRFITDCKDRYGNITDPCQAFWQFENDLPNYDFWGYDDFELVISTNYGGEPTLYLLNPKDADKLILIEARNEHLTRVSIGSGKSLLDAAFGEYLADNGKIGLNELEPSELVYGWCAWFMQFAQGDKASELEKYGVGGYFHFWIQTPTETSPQKTCLYVLNSVFCQTIYPYFYRIGYMENGQVLALNDLIQTDLHIVKNIWDRDDADQDIIKPELRSRPYRQHGEHYGGISSYNTDNQRIIALCDQFVASPFYFFCSFGFAHPAQQFRINHFNKSGKHHWVIGYPIPNISEEWVKIILGFYVEAHPTENSPLRIKPWREFTKIFYKKSGANFDKCIKYPEMTFVDSTTEENGLQNKWSLGKALKSKDGHPVQDGYIQMGRGFVYTSQGCRDFVFPSFPHGLLPYARQRICEQLARERFVALGMVCDFRFDHEGAQFRCTTRQLRPNGTFGRKVKEWATDDFIEETRSLFVRLVNLELEKASKAPDYEV